MLNRFRSVVSNVMGGISALPPSGEKAEGGGPGQRQRSRSLPSPATDTDPSMVKYGYNRPAFLQLNADEVQVSADTISRPILVPRDISRLPWNAGYAEVINAGKTKLSEDQAWAGLLNVPRHPSSVAEVQSLETTQTVSPHGNSVPSSPTHASSSTPSNAEYEILADDPLPFTYFGLFDGHAGTGAAIMAVKLLHKHIQVQLSLVRDLLIAKRYNLDLQPSPHGGAGRGLIGRQGLPDKTHLINVDDLVVGALETAFQNMDDQIADERVIYKIAGGCTALVALFFMGKLYIANAGDSRAVLCCRGRVVPMSSDFTPDSERQRIQYLGYLQPELLHSEFTHLEFPRRVSRRDVGKKMLYKDALMKGWAYKTITENDLKFPLVYGEGKRARVLATIGVTRGFGDHDLTVQSSDIHIKPFLLSIPQVKIYNICDYDHSENDILIMGSDGLWDVTSNEKAASIVCTCLQQFELDDRSRYTSAAQELVMYARGLLKKGWRTPDDTPASGDDITAFVIPLHSYCNSPSESSSTESSVDASSS